jgi:hypothetical protein
MPTHIDEQGILRVDLDDPDNLQHQLDMAQKLQGWAGLLQELAETSRDGIVRLPSDTARNMAELLALMAVGTLAIATGQADVELRHKEGVPE